MPVLQVTTQQLEYLVAIHRADTWSAAATAVGVTPSALSQGIAELERRVGLTLFERDGRRRVPTRDHPAVLAYAQGVLARTEDLGRWIERRRSGTTGEVRLGLIDAAATHHFVDELRRFRAERPDVALRLTVAPSAQLLGQLGHAELDLVVCVAPETPIADIATEHLLHDPLAVLAPAGTSARAPAHWGPWVTFPAGSHTRALVAERLRAEGAPFEVVAESHQPEVLREMVRLGIGWTVLPVGGLGDVDDLTVVRAELAHRTLVLARRSDTTDDPGVDALAAAIAAGALRSGA